MTMQYIYSVIGFGISVINEQQGQYSILIGVPFLCLVKNGNLIATKFLRYD
jgi:hypothetical protein